MADEQAEDPVHAVAAEPSFHGRLKLDQFMYSSMDLRRSPRLGGGVSGLPLPSRSPSKTPSTSPGRVTKSKHVSQGTIGKGSRTSSPKKRAKVPSSYAPPSTYAHLPPLLDVIAPNLLILFVGLNPGIQTARTGHAYAHPSNLFWKLLYSSGITPVPCKAEEDRTLPERFSLGNTNIVSRPSRNGAELSKAEMDEGVEILEEKARKWRPEVVCIVGKSIWESIWRVRKGKAIKKEEFNYGWQGETENMGIITSEMAEDGEAYAGARVFVATSTSGLAATLRPAEKEMIWKELGDWCKQRRKERGERTEMQS
ncbi:uracil-DNA glycosylase-like protein [Xylariales sp. PMI_506]|nr:uracil-DNA glycosylase-like protein [Xylariales sp. PMI_506]